jgi:hypothetical protein
MSSYTLLWVQPNAEAAPAPSLRQLDDQLGTAYAHVMYGTTQERRGEGLTAIRLFGRANQDMVISIINKMHYVVVESEVRGNRLGRHRQLYNHF